MARCIVFGGNGFVGSHLIDELVSRGYEVTCFMRPTKNPPMYSSSGVRQIFGDFMNEGDVSSALVDQDYVFHFISTTTPATADQDPEFDIQTNVVSSIKLFRQCVNSDIKRVYFASTGGAIYGDQGNKPLSESSLAEPISPYAIGKLAIENYRRFFKRKHNLDYVVFRISNPYGARQNPKKRQGVVPIFMKKILDGDKVTVVGDGSMVRDYLYIDDATSMMANIVDRGECRYSVYNIASGKGESVDSIVKGIERVVGHKIEVSNIKKPATFVDSITLDVSRYVDEFGDMEFISIDEGIERTWRDMQNV